MSAIKGKTVEGDAPQVHRIRITLTSQNVEALEKGESTAAPQRSCTAQFFCAF